MIHAKAMTSKTKSHQKFEQTTKLSDLGLPHIDVILTERFLLPPEALKKIGSPVPEDLGDLVQMSGMPFLDVLVIIEECLALDKDLRIQIRSLDEEAKKPGVILLDVRPGVDLFSDPLHPDARLFHTQNIQSFLPFLKSLERVVVISESDGHAWSAAASLKKLGIRAVLPMISSS
jgi:rhodanese-related sulfurtransferase